MVVQPAHRSHLPSIVAIYNHYVARSVATFDVEPVTVEERVSWFDQFGADHPLLVAVEEDRVLGYAYYLPFRARVAYVRTKECSVYVTADGQRRGVGAALYGELIEHARPRGVHVLLGVLGGDNVASVRLHERLGFRRVGHLREVGFKHGAYVDTHYYQLILS